MTTHVFLVSIHHYKPCHMHSHIFVFHLCRTNELDVWCFKYYHNMFINDLTTTMVVQLHHNTCLLGVHPSLQTLPYALTYLSFPIMSHWRARLLVLEIVSQNVHFEVRSYPPKKTGAGIGLLTETGALLKRQLRGTWAMRERERETIYVRCTNGNHCTVTCFVSPLLSSKGAKGTHSINQSHVGLNFKPLLQHITFLLPPSGALQFGPCPCNIAPKMPLRTASERKKEREKEREKSRTATTARFPRFACFHRNVLTGFYLTTWGAYMLVGIMPSGTYLMEEKYFWSTWNL